METMRERLSGPTFGAWISGDPISCEIMTQAGYDWLILETQHRAMAPERMLSALQATGLGPTPTFVRVGGVELLEISRALDIGAAGVIVPVVNTAAEARAVTQVMRYPPDGTRSYGVVRSGLPRGTVADPICVLMIETTEALGNLDEIAAVPGVDVLFVGLHDLALSMGIKPGAGLEPATIDALGRVVAACNRHGVTPGCASFGFDNARLLISLGMRFISVGADGAFLRLGAEEDGRRIEKLHRELRAEV